MTQRPIFLYALCGSQRQASTSRRLLQALQLACPDGVSIAICDLIGALPIFNPDDEGERTPPVVERFAAEIRKADGLIVSCPEYAHGIPGGFKNALDWLVSRDEVPFKPLMLAHASHRGDLVLAQLTEVLQTMSLHIVADAFLRLPIAGKSDEAQAAMLLEAHENGLLSGGLSRFAQTIATRA
ncbi:MULTISPECIES: NADPH-dependent FMN reductase [unclassified Rhizobium]|uniref:NADPH-dependent FMN reductase n=1 Tax=unclassified Rhizobium TaxID=2613769 RepID=UPI00160D03E8|nr:MULTISPECIES: NADPH-dependent FMN reductase [unclassified Rhizobium]MBB3289818.1 NAD(P)H-dependent FMN reductase [Rhizobium sp. BK252]MBB3404047.1 NAD(P)H-dependent FMN reductase [Rhizobium sp. BK289]MBB3417146.1 NAD(P)H-dependent FMN reductase [Rhizobium sp. BK284]MBB3485023.1 NAD(P)H-dependent FMN reductase [Rhizobium sp. BK347]MDK4722645.1 NAD(P)H-dependent oxidoreductase [Rhizobium sp. CNPSo 3968]